MCPDLTVFGKKLNIPMTESPERQCLRRAKDGAADSSRPLTLEACLQTVHVQTKETPCGTVWVPAGSRRQSRPSTRVARPGWGGRQELGALGAERVYLQNQEVKPLSALLSSSKGVCQPAGQVDLGHVGSQSSP